MLPGGVVIGMLDVVFLNNDRLKVASMLIEVKCF
jgi:hypothetical protein